MAEETTTEDVEKQVISGNTEEDWKVFDVLCKEIKVSP